MKRAFSLGTFLALALLAAFGVEPLSGGEANVKEVEDRLLAEASANIEKYRKGPADIRVISQQDTPAANAQIEIRQTGHEFLFGCIIFDLVRSEEPYKADLFKKRFKELFNFAVFPFYWAGYEREKGKTNQANIDKVVSWCQANGITTKGHPLVWTNKAGVPQWIKPLSAEEREKLLLNRVGREVGTFAGKIDIWDVVNEPVNCRAWGHAGVADYIKEPVDRIADYVDKAFRAAHAANPDACLILNEFNTIARPDTRQRFYELAVELKMRATPISGLGIQAHEPRQHWYPPEETWATFEKLASLGYDLHITEFIPHSGGKAITGGWRRGKWDEQTQAEFAEQFFRLSFGHPAVVSINWWGFTDRRIWLPGGGLLTRDYEPKPVYKRLVKLIHDEWKTRKTVSTDSKGCARFRGFYGKYKVAVKTAQGKTYSFDANLARGRQNTWLLRLK